MASRALFLSALLSAAKTGLADRVEVQLHTTLTPDYAWDVERFAIAQKKPSDLSDAMVGTQGYDQALSELKSGSKVGHWVWYIFPSSDFHIGPDRKEVGSPTNKFFSLRSTPELKAYLDHATLGPHLVAAWKAVLGSSATTMGLGAVGSVMDGPRMNWFVKHFSATNAAFKAESDAAKSKDISENPKSKIFVGDRRKFYGHLMLFEKYSGEFHTKEKDAKKKAWYKEVFDTVTAVMQKAKAEGLDPAGTVQASSPDTSSWKEAPTESEYREILQKRETSLTEMNTGEQDKLAVPPAGWVFLKDGVNYVAPAETGYPCKAWCSQLKAKLK